MGYIVTNQDRMSMIEIMNHAWHVRFQATKEKGSNYTRWDIQAVNPTDKTYYSTDGASISEAVDNWLAKTGIVKEEPTTLYESKQEWVYKELDLIEVTGQIGDEL